ncbi:hypothetical protein AYI69_g7078, partial [Smittium culicis]
MLSQLPFGPVGPPYL